MQILISFLMLPIMILNFAGGIVGGIWLLIIGKGWLVLYAIIITLTSTWVIGLVLTPTILLAMPLTKAIEKKRYLLAYLWGILAGFWTYLIMTIWCVGSFVLILSNYDTGLVWPYLFLAYSVASGPWTYMASKEGSTEIDGTTIGAFFVCLGAFAMIVVTLMSNGATLMALIITFSIAMVIAWILNTALFVYKVKESKIKIENTDL